MLSICFSSRPFAYKRALWLAPQRSVVLQPIIWWRGGHNGPFNDYRRICGLVRRGYKGPWWQYIDLMLHDLKKNQNGRGFMGIEGLEESARSRGLKGDKGGGHLWLSLAMGNSWDSGAWVIHCGLDGVPRELTGPSLVQPRSPRRASYLGRYWLDLVVRSHWSYFVSSLLDSPKGWVLLGVHALSLVGNLFCLSSCLCLQTLGLL